MEKLKLEDFQKYRFLSCLEFAPEGGDAAFLCAKADMEENGYNRDLWLLKDGKTTVRLTGDGKAGGFLWEDGHTLLFASPRDPEAKKKQEAGEEYTAFYRIDTRGGEAVLAFSVPLNASLCGKLRDGRFLLRVDWDMRFSKAYALTGKAREALLREKNEEKEYQVVDELPFYFNGQGFINKHRDALFLFDEQSGALTRVTKEPFATDSVRLDETRSRVLYTGEAYTSKRRNKAGVYLFDAETGETTELLRPRVYDIYDAFFWGGEILFIGTDQKRFGLNENAQFYLLNPETREIRLFAPFEQAIGSSVGSDCRLGGGEALRTDGKNLYFTATIRSASHVYALRETGAIEPIYEREGSVDCFDLSGGSLFFVGMQDNRLQEIYTFDPASGSQEPVTQFNGEALKGVYVAEPQRLSFENDGTDLDGWVLLPKDFDPQKRYPGILDIHGGPKTVYGEVFYHEMQFWANEGYFVFFCNPRGGDGRGNEFADLRGKYGTIDYDDLMKFCDEVLAAWPQLDENRLAVTGGSYGGFMTNWIIGHTNRFSAAASQRSIANWIGFGFTSDIGDGFARDQMGLGEHGSLWKDGLEKLWFHSPLKYLDRCTTPTLFIHSDEDYRCPLSEGYQMVAALKQLGVETRMCIFHGENHELSRSGKPLHRVRRLREITQWFAKHV